MGLPLYRAPVESDLKAKVPKDPPTRARSTIRRPRRSLNDPSSRSASTSAHYYSRRTGPGPRARIISPSSAESPWTPWDNVEPAAAEPHAASRSATRRPGASDPLYLVRDSTTQDHTGRREPVLREVITRNGPMSQEVVRYFGQHMARLYADTSSRGGQDWDETPPAAGDRERESASPDDEPLLLEGDEFNQRPTSFVHFLHRQNERLIVMRRTLRAQELSAMREGREARARRSTPGDATLEARFDGLGDRNRSLSPEGDGVWDTLLSSITPDPQPPSVGTSFASTSAATSQPSTASGANSANSSRTSLADGPDGSYSAEVIGFADACESGGDNSDTEGDEEEEARENILRRFGRSHGDMAERDDDDIEVFGGVESMQRIVRNLARREDIPDEWWAEAGLSRTLGREGS
ncbi:hypothetical protein INS49_005555 [Diaporthe citri]|uniref:uncharacterized protein n=1 Tax=Diaporthe citri TaxID=83186 RepID=UPI001C81BB94|nr:uncharacterized protein INS49_005555 [Diaporthe citri]KAG6353593.1 hypothetical protein INS49_005555 [Diaporthe citri]